MPHAALPPLLLLLKTGMPQVALDVQHVVALASTPAAMLQTWTTAMTTMMLVLVVPKATATMTAVVAVAAVAVVVAVVLVVVLVSKTTATVTKAAAAVVSATRLAGLAAPASALALRGRRGSSSVSSRTRTSELHRAEIVRRPFAVGRLAVAVVCAAPWGGLVGRRARNWCGLQALGPK